MDANAKSSRIAIVGTGLIGSSWTACFLAHGLDVVATDPAPGAEDKVRQHIEGAWAALTKIGLSPGASTSRVRFEPDLKEAVAGADLVQENAPEREPVKIKLPRTSIRSFPRLPYWRRVQAPGALRNRTSLQSAAPDSAGRGGRRTSGSALPGSSLSDRPGCGQRGGRRCRSVHGSGSALGSDGTEPDLPPGRRTRRYSSLL